MTTRPTLKSILDQANPNTVADALRRVGLGTALEALITPVEEVVLAAGGKVTPTQQPLAGTLKVRIGATDLVELAERTLTAPTAAALVGAAFPLALAPGDAIGIAVDGAAEATATFTGTADTATAANPAPYDTTANNEITVDVNGDGPLPVQFTGSAAVADAGFAEPYNLGTGTGNLLVRLNDDGAPTEVVFEGTQGIQVAAAETYGLAPAQTLEVTVNGNIASPKTLTVGAGGTGYVNEALATAAEVVADFNAQLVPADPLEFYVAAGPAVGIRSKRYGSTSTVLASGGTALAAFNFAAAVDGEGVAADLSAATAAEVAAAIQADLAPDATCADVGGVPRITTTRLGSSAALAFPGGDTLGPTFNFAQTTPGAGNVANRAAVTAQEVVDAIAAVIDPANAVADLNGGAPRVTSRIHGTNSDVTIGGAANGVIGFPAGAGAGGNVGAVENVQAAEAKAVIEAAIPGVTVNALAPGLLITSNTTGASSTLEAAAVVPAGFGIAGAASAAGDPGGAFTVAAGMFYVDPAEVDKVVLPDGTADGASVRIKYTSAPLTAAQLAAQFELE